MNKFSHSSPTRIEFGVGTFEKAAKLMAGFGKKAYIITSRSFSENAFPDNDLSEILKKLMHQLEQANIEYASFESVEPNPKTDQIEKVSEVVKDFRPRFIIALGGGSVIDFAKAVALLYCNPGKITDFTFAGSSKEFTKFNKALPVVCIPTLAATGSEVSFYSVVTDQKTQSKLTIFNEALYPKLSIIDPSLAVQCSPKKTAVHAFDVLTHVLETYLSSESFFFDRLSESLALSIFFALDKITENPSDLNARATLAWASCFAMNGNFLGRDGPWPIHALEHGLSGITDVSHSLGLVFLLPRVMLFDAKFIPEKIISFNEKIFGTKKNFPEAALEAGLYKKMRELGIWISSIEELSSKITAESGDAIIQSAVEKTFEIDSVKKTNEPWFLDNCGKIFQSDALAILKMKWDN